MPVLNINNTNGKIMIICDFSSIENSNINNNDTVNVEVFSRV